MRASPPCLIAAMAGLALATAAAAAAPTPQTRAGLDALAKGDNETAARLFTEALLYGSAARADRELAYVKRAQAFLALGRDADALADAKRALALDPRDAEAIAVRDRAKSPAPAIATAARRAPGAPAEPSDALNNGIKTKLDAVESRNKAAFDKYQADMAAYEAQKAAIAAQAKADQDAYAAGLAAHEAEVQAQKDQQAAAMADWRRRVEACRHGDHAQCAH